MSEEEIFQQALDTISNLPDITASPQTPIVTPTLEEPNLDVENEIKETINLNLPITAQERTFITGVKITTDGTLQRARGNEWDIIDTNVRSFIRSADIRNRAYFYIKNDNTLWGFGSNDNGKLGDGTGVNKDESIHILDNVASVHLAGRLVYALQTDGTLLTWGNGKFSPVEFAANVASFDVFITSYGRAVVIYQTMEGHIYTTGFDLHDGSTTQERLLPETVFDVSRSVATAVGRIYHGVYYINASHTLMRRNYRSDGRTGTPIFVEEREIASDVKKLFSFPTTLNAMPNTFFITSDSTLWALGANANGELGDGTRVPRDEPVRIAENVAYIRPFMFLQNDGTLWEWNQNNPTPQQTHYNVAYIQDGFIHFQSGILLYREREFEDVKIPRTLTFE